ncbi:MAG: glycosyltransferase family 4 protein [Candidatus Dormibacteraeota bacterium]|uniref:Glycosyltransferase n=1 Tax=Candidatus Aeolococcus gillhamiae TaxID=3127015 RepID=A0A2W6B0C5_9BACT|nr:glycosyltransferase family 4 protein [Candidatus Dormibacteraeota bacterium]PZR83791.1 MAG: glycosyltransferase [Candidatus Dormibacter sp. RRmetagenome_bin12]
MTQRHVVVVAPPWYPVPPDGYGGIELVVALLCDALRGAGHQVTLLAAEGSRPDAMVLAPRSWRGDLGRPEERLRELTYAARVADALEDLGRIDVIHDHCGFATLMATCAADLAPVLHTVHGDIPETYSAFYSSMARRAHFVSISVAQRRGMPELPWIGTVHNAVDVDSLRVTASKEPYLLCLARICPDKGQQVAIEAARRSGMRLVLAGKVEDIPEAADYFDRLVAPAIDGDRVVHIANVAGAEKARLLSHASALLAPLQWEEPFGLAMVEAMASGTPVIAMARGAAPELVTEGVTGFLVDDVDGMVAAVPRTTQVDPWRCAEVTRTRFGPDAMAAAYLRLYETLIWKPPVVASPAHGADDAEAAVLAGRGNR